MPFDGTDLNPNTKLLIEAKQVLIQSGWCVGALRTSDGRRCALDAVRGDIYWKNTDSIIQRLAAAIPADFDFGFSGQLPSDSKIARYNNAQTSVEPILEWFDRAIAAEV